MKIYSDNKLNTSFDSVNEAINKYIHSKSTDIQQRCYEFLEFSRDKIVPMRECSENNQVEDIKELIENDVTLSFLDD